MKYFYLTIITLLSVFTLQAQEGLAIEACHRGNFVLGTRFGLSAQNNQVTTTIDGTTTNSSNFQSSFTLTPTVSYFVVSNFLVGLGMDYTANASSNAGTKSANSRILFGPHLRYYLPSSNNDALFFGLITGFGRTDNSSTVNGVSQTNITNISSFGFGPGYTIISNRRLALEAQIKYNFGIFNSIITSTGTPSSTQRTNSNGGDFVVGLQYYLVRGNRD